jgi:hypothetical protein
MVHPVVVDRGPKATGARYFGLAFTEKSVSSRFLWAQPIIASGEAKDDATAWLTSDVTPSPGKPGGLDGVTAVCSLDATADANGSVGVAMVVRRGTKNQVLFAKFVDGALQANVAIAYEVTFNDGTNVCQIGLVGARIASIGGTFALTFSDKQSAVGSPAPLYYWSSASGKPPTKADFDVWTSDTAFGGHYATLTNRGLVPAMPVGETRWQVFGESSDGGQRAIVVQTVVAPATTPQ